MENGQSPLDLHAGISDGWNGDQVMTNTIKHVGVPMVSHGKAQLIVLDGVKLIHDQLPKDRKHFKA